MQTTQTEYSEKKMLFLNIFQRYNYLHIFFIVSSKYKHTLESQNFFFERFIKYYQ